MEWCESAVDLDAAAIASGGCVFAPATPNALARGYSPRAFWLRLTIANSYQEEAERWLQFGDSRTERVRFLEADGQGWRESRSGLSVAPAERTVPATDPVLPLTFKPLETRVILIQVISRSSIHLSATLWRRSAWLEAHYRTEFSMRWPWEGCWSLRC